MEMRRNLNERGKGNTEQYKRLNRNISKETRRDIRRYNTKVITATIEKKTEV